MTPVMQEFPDHDPDNGIVGDCFRAALASLMDLPLAEIPHFYGQTWPDGRAGSRGYNGFLAERGLLMIECRGLDFDKLRQDGAGDCYHLLLGFDGKDHIPHACVGLNGRIVHDPNHEEPGLGGDPSEWVIGLLVRTGTR